MLSLLGSDAVETCFKCTTDTTDALHIKALAAFLAAHDGRHEVEAERRLVLVYSTTEGKNEVISYLHVQEVVSVDWAFDNCDVSVGVENWVEEAGSVWSDAFMHKMVAYLAGEKGRPRAMPPRVGLPGWLEPVDPGTLYIRRECKYSDRLGLRGWLEPVDPGTLYIRRECRYNDSGAQRSA